jgi:hypothetical protein
MIGKHKHKIWCCMIPKLITTIAGHKCNPCCQKNTFNQPLPLIFWAKLFYGRETHSQFQWDHLSPNTCLSNACSTLVTTHKKIWKKMIGKRKIVKLCYKILFFPQFFPRQHYTLVRLKNILIYPMRLNYEGKRICEQDLSSQKLSFQ